MALFGDIAIRSAFGTWAAGTPRRWSSAYPRHSARAYDLTCTGCECGQCGGQTTFGFQVASTPFGLSVQT